MHTVVGSRLAALRAMRGFTVAALAIAADIPAEAVERHEAGEAMSSALLRRFAGVLRVGLSAFFLDEAEYLRVAPASNADTWDGLRLVTAFQAIENAHLRSMLIEIAEQFGERI